MSRFTRMLSNTAKPMPHAGRLLAQVMKQSLMTNTKVAQRLGIAPSGVNQYCKQPTLHAALLWKLGEILEYDFFAALSKEFPLKQPSEKELDLQQQIIDLKKENELYKNLLMGKLG